MEYWIIISIPLIILNGFIIYWVNGRKKGEKIHISNSNDVLWTPKSNINTNTTSIDFSEGVEVEYSKGKEFIQSTDTLESFIEIKHHSKIINTERLI